MVIKRHKNDSQSDTHGHEDVKILSSKVKMHAIVLVIIYAVMNSNSAGKMICSPLSNNTACHILTTLALAQPKKLNEYLFKDYDKYVLPVLKPERDVLQVYVRYELIQLITLLREINSKWS